MLVSLSIQNVVLIDRLTITFQPGFCALTGETGAGKSILLDSLGLALGARSESGLVRKGAEQAQVTAEFQINDLSHPVCGILQEAGLDTDHSLLLRRSVGSDGRSKAYINDQPVSVGLLRQIGDTLVEIHGQFDTHGLLNTSTHRRMLDEYTGEQYAVGELWAGWKKADEGLEHMKNAAAQARTQEAYLRQSIEDLDALSPEQGEEEELAALRERLMSREQVLAALNAAYNTLNGEDDPVRAAWGALDRVAGKLGPAGEAITASLQRASSEIEEASQEIAVLSIDLQDTEHSLESIDDRLHALRAQARKHGCTVDELPALREKLAAELNMIEHGDDMLAQKMKEVEQARAAYIKEAEALRAARQKAATKLDKLVLKELEPLKLGKARFLTMVEPLEESDWGQAGMDKVQFLVATNPGAEPGPLNKIASGGEMARFMLALKVVMAEIGSAGTLVFDEVDTGIGGGTADAVGERLARLAARCQVLVVTHAPQVAARAGHHYIVRKDGAKEVKTDIAALNSLPERREEIARMLAGATITEEARAAADKLLETGRAA